MIEKFKQITEKLSGQGIVESLSVLNESRPKAYISIALGITAFGYFCISFFPLLLVISFFKVTGGIFEASSWGQWLSLLVWLLVGAGAGLVTYTQLRVKISMPSGVGLKQEKAPKFYELLAELKDVYKYPKIHRVIVHDEYELEYIPVPRIGLPLVNINVLYVGLPVLQALSPIQFRAHLGGRLGQYSATHNKLSHWVYRWRQYCKIYQHNYSKISHPLYLPIKLFYKLYTPILNTLTVHMAREDELEADVYSLELMNDEDLRDIVIRDEVTRVFLAQKYWPKIYSMLKKTAGAAPHLPHENMAKVIKNGMNDHEIASTMEKLMNSKPEWQDNHPGLYARLNYIGQTTLDLPPPLMETAARRYLNEAYAPMIKVMDKQWLSKTQSKSSRSQKKVTAPPEQQHDDVTLKTPTAVENNTRVEVTGEAAQAATAQQQQHLKELLIKSKNGGLLQEADQYELAALTEKVHGTKAAIPFYQKVLKQNPSHSKTILAVGRILLSQNDKSGVKALEKAMALDPGCSGQACWLLAKYFRANGDEAHAKHYVELAAQFSNNSTAAA